MDKELINNMTPLISALGDDNGDINIIWDTISSATSYVIQMKKGKRSKWKHVDIVIGNRFSISELKEGSYSFRIAPVFKNGQGRWSDEIVREIS